MIRAKGKKRARMEKQTSNQKRQTSRAAANAGKQRPTTTAAAAQAARQSGVAQRMLINLGDTQREEEGENYLRDSDPTEFRKGDIENFKNLEDGEVLHFLSHAGGDTLGSYKSQGLANIIAAMLQQKAVEQGWRTLSIQLHGCESMDFAAQLEAKLQEEIPTIPTIRVQGVPGYSAITKEGAEYSIGRTHGSDELWDQISNNVNRDPSQERLENLMAQQASLLQKIDAKMELFKKCIDLSVEAYETEKKRIQENYPKIYSDPEELETELKKDLAKLEQDYEKQLLDNEKDQRRINHWTKNEKHNAVIVHMERLRSTEAALQAIRGKASALIVPQTNPAITDHFLQQPLLHETDAHVPSIETEIDPSLLEEVGFLDTAPPQTNAAITEQPLLHETGTHGEMLYNQDEIDAIFNDMLKCINDLTLDFNDFKDTGQ